MSKGLINDSTLTEIADAIRAKTESTDTMLPSEMAALIMGILTGNPDFMIEGEYLEITGVSGTVGSVKIPCSMSEAPTRMVVRGNTYGNNAIKLMAIVNDEHVQWHSSSGVDYGNSSYNDAAGISLADGYVTVTFGSGSFSSSATYKIWMWR